MKTKDITTIAICLALMCVLSPLSIPLSGGVPISLATFVVMVLAIVLKQYKSMIVVALYLLLGLIGLPVFGNFSSGASILFGMTGGYLFGYLLLAYITGLFASKFESKEAKIKNIYLMSGMILGTAALYILGTAYFMKYTGMNLQSSMMACVIPFIPGDLIKMIVALIVSPRIEKLAK